MSKLNLDGNSNNSYSSESWYQHTPNDSYLNNHSNSKFAYNPWNKPTQENGFYPADSPISDLINHNSSSNGRSKISDSESTSSSRQSFPPTFSLIYGLQSRDNASFRSQPTSTPAPELEKLFGTDDPIALALAFNTSPEFYQAPPLEGVVPVHRPPPPVPSPAKVKEACGAEPKLSLDSRAPGYRPPVQPNRVQVAVAKPIKTQEQNREKYSPTPVKSSAQELQELVQWAKGALKGVSVQGFDIPTAVEVMAAIDAPYEVEAMFLTYLGDSPKVQHFVREFLDRRRPYWQLQKEAVKHKQQKKTKKEPRPPSTNGSISPSDLSSSHADDSLHSNNNSQVSFFSNPPTFLKWKHIKVKKSKSGKQQQRGLQQRS
ncbi:GRB10 interacting GYF protein 1 [Cichlidogyrus casuarinus]|uniref:GRB10 interacting GYF protein 1 n=1 Tax=Cichlidogyrus casuarinus TaxID=1844966 RepID=A0ABD2QEJ6_9PLAT